MPACASPTPRWIRGLLTWLTCALSGLLGAALSAPDAQASPLYLAAGVALACVLGWGRWMLLPIGLGGATVAIAPAALTGGMVPEPALLALACASGIGAAAQAWVGHTLIRRCAPMSGTGGLALDTPRDIAVFMLLAGPVAGAVHPAIQVATQVALGLPGAVPWPQAFVCAWAGHALGTLVAAPMMLTLVGQPSGLWRARRDLVGVPLLVATALLLVAVRQVESWRTEREAAVFNQDVGATANAVNLRLSGFLDALAALNGIYEGSERVSRAEFARASRYWIDTLKGMQAMGWNARIPASAVDAHEAEQRAAGAAGFEVYNAPENLAYRGQEAVVLTYIEPARGNQKALGFNVLSRAASAAAFEQARREGRVIATRGFKLIQESGGQTGVVVYHPVYKGGKPATPPERMRTNAGVVFLALRMDDTLAAMLQGRPAYLDACLVDATEHARPLLAGSPGCRQGEMGQKSRHRAVVPIEFAGRQWQLVTWNSAPVPLVGQEATTWILAVGGAAFAAALGGLLLVMTGHARRVEEAMEESRRQRAAAETANRAKSEFMSRMSHELRTPLNAVLGFAQLMEMDQHHPLPAAQSSRVEQIQQAGWHLLDMIDDVLDISRLDTGTMRLQAEPLRIRDELATTVKLMQADAKRQGVELILPNDIPSEWGVTADAARLRQILGNLLSNAIKFNRRGGQVRLKVTRTEGPGQGGTEAGPTLHIAVEDNGIGMSEAQLGQLFQPFNRLGREQSAIGGTGVGLVVGRHLALLMGGQLGVRSTEGQGSVFTLCLPALTLAPRLKTPAPIGPAAPGPAPAEAAGTRPPPRPRHVLYVEDNVANSEVIRSALGARPWVTVSVASTSEEGLAVLHNRLTGSKPDLILLDVHLPDASGLELLKLIKSNPDTVDIPVIMISADAMPEQVDAALSAGASCYLTKPVQLAELLRQVDELMPA